RGEHRYVDLAPPREACLRRQLPRLPLTGLRVPLAFEPLPLPPLLLDPLFLEFAAVACRERGFDQDVMRQLEAPLTAPILFAAEDPPLDEKVELLARDAGLKRRLFGLGLTRSRFAQDEAVLHEHPR